MTSLVPLYDHLGSLHHVCMEKIRLVAFGPSETDLTALELLEDERADLAHQAFEAIELFLDFLEVVRAKDGGRGIEFDAYEEKLAYHKQKLAQAQLHAEQAVQEYIQTQRMSRFGSVEQPLSDQEKREALFGRREAADAKSATQSSILDKNTAITAALQTTRQMMATSIMHTELNIDLIEQQTKDMSRLNDKYTDFNELLSKLKAIVKFIQKQDRQDKNRIYMSVGFFFAVCAWVIWRRILKMPVKIFLWAVLRTFGLVNWVVLKGSGETTVTTTMMTSMLGTLLVLLDASETADTTALLLDISEMIQESAQTILDVLRDEL